MCVCVQGNRSDLHSLNEAVHQEGVLRERLMENLKEQHKVTSQPAGSNTHTAQTHFCATNDCGAC